MIRYSIVLVLLACIAFTVGCGCDSSDEPSCRASFRLRKIFTDHSKGPFGKQTHESTRIEAAVGDCILMRGEDWVERIPAAGEIEANDSCCMITFIGLREDGAAIVSSRPPVGFARRTPGRLVTDTIAVDSVGVGIFKLDVIYFLSVDSVWVDDGWRLFDRTPVAENVTLTDPIEGWRCHDRTFWGDGALRYDRPLEFFDGYRMRTQGVFRRNAENGRLLEETEYVDGLPRGQRTVWNDSGDVLKTGQYDKGVGIVVNREGQALEELVQPSADAPGAYRTWYDNRQIAREMTFESAREPRRSFYVLPEDFLRETAGRGDWLSIREWRPNGTLRVSRVKGDSSRPCVSTEYYYYRSGARQAVFSGPTLQSSDSATYWRPDGALGRNPHGKWTICLGEDGMYEECDCQDHGFSSRKRFFSDGAPAGEGRRRYGEVYGPWEFWDRDGELQERIDFGSDSVRVGLERRQNE